LDLETLDLLEETVGDYPGTVLVVSHDRDFLDRVATMTVMAEGGGRFAVYAGGYSDMVAQRGEGAVKAPPKVERKAAAPKSRPGREEAVKLSFSDQHALNTLPERIEGLNREIAALQDDLSDPSLYSRDPEKFALLSEQLAERMASRDTQEELWLVLEMRREALGQQSGK